MSLRKTDRAQCFRHSTVQQSIVKWFFVLLLVMVALNLHPYRVRFSVTAMSTRKNICAVGVDDALALRCLIINTILDNDFFGGDSDVSDAASGSADSDSDEDSDLEPRAQRVCGDENSKAGGSVDENVALWRHLKLYLVIYNYFHCAMGVVQF